MQASCKWQVLVRVEFPSSFSWNTSLDISVSASHTSFFLYKITIALINERAKGGKGWLIGERHVPFYRVSVTCRGEKLSVATLVPKEDKKKRGKHTVDGQINYSGGTTMARAASLLALIKLSPLPRALLPPSVQPIATY